MNKLAYVLIFLFISNSHSVESIVSDGEFIIVTTSVKYHLGDSDSLAFARKITLQLAKKKASEAAGSYVQSEKIIENGQLKSSSIAVISSGQMTTRVINEKLKVDDSGRIVINLFVEVKIDKQSLMAQLGLIQYDKDLKLKVEKLEESNKLLSDRLRLLSFEIDFESDEANKETLISKRKHLLGEIISLETDIVDVFEINEISKVISRGSSSFTKAKNDIDTNIFRYIKNRMKVNTGDPIFIKKEDGTYDISVQVSLSIEAKPIVKTLNKYFRNFKGGDLEVGMYDFQRNIDSFKSNSRGVIGLKVHRYSNEKDKQKLEITKYLYDYLLTKQVRVVINYAGFTESLTIASSRFCFISCKEETGNTQYQFMLDNTSDTSSTLFLLQSNPLIINSVSSDRIKKSHRFEANVEVI